MHSNGDGRTAVTTKTKSTILSSAMTYMVQSSHCTSGVARIPHWGAGVPLPPLPSLFPSPSLPLPHFRSRPLKYSEGSGGAYSQNRLWCILALKTDIWWQQF